MNSNISSLNGRRAILAIILFISVFSCAAGLQLVTALDGSNDPSASANGDSCAPVISTDGRYILFTSTANNLVATNINGPVPGTTLHALNVFLQDRLTGMTTLGSVNLQGDGGNGNSIPDGISTNDQYVLFESGASDLVPGDSNNLNDIFMRDLVTGTTTLVSVNTNGVSANKESRSATMTPDGHFVVFTSDATDLVPGDTNGISDVFIRDMLSGTTTLVSVGARSSAQLKPPDRSEAPVMTPDGRFVAFFSTATNLVPDAQRAGEVYVRDTVEGTTIWASTNARSYFSNVLGPTNAVSCDPVISSDGRYVTYLTCTNRTTSSTFIGQGIILQYDTLNGTTRIVYTNAYLPSSSYADINILGMSTDGRFVSFIAKGSSAANTIVYLWDADAETNMVVSVDQTGQPANGLCDLAILNPTGQFVAFTSSGSNLTTNTLAAGSHLYVRDMQAGTTQLIDVSTNSFGVGIDPAASTIAMSDDGQFVAFDSPYENFVPDDRNRENDVFLRDLVAGTTELISTHAPALASQTPDQFSEIFPTSVSTNGRYIAFISDADNLVANDTNKFRDVFVRDLWSGTNILVSVGTNGLGASSYSSEVAISGNGRYVAFSSVANNLVGNDKNKSLDIFVRDLQMGTTAVISTNVFAPTITTGNYDSFKPLISNNGRYILFDSYAGNITPTQFGTINLVLHDGLVGTNYALTSAQYNSSGPGVFTASMTPDGRYVAYVGKLTGDFSARFFLWDSQAAKIVYTNTTISGGVISPDGHWLAYISGSILNLFDLVAKTNVAVAAGNFRGAINGRRFDDSGRFFVFATTAKLVNTDTNGTYDVYLYDLQGQTNLISRSFGSASAANGASDSATISPDGRYIAYRSLASNIVPNDFNKGADVFLYDRVNDTTTLISANRSSTAAANGWSGLPVFSGDSSTLVFESYASNLPGPGFNEFSAIYALKLSSSITDSDSDGMDDNWEMQYFGSLARDGTGDYDGDGANDLFEFLTGTDPTDSNSKFVATITGTLVAEQNPTINWPLSPGKSYRVQFKNDLNDTNWQDVNGSIVLMGNEGRITDLTPATGQRFYRIVLNN